jgi:phage gp29-like protein
MTTFRDWLGRVIAGRDLFSDIAGARVGGMRSWWSDHPADGLTPRKLAAIHLAAAQGSPLAYLELAEDIEERDLHYAGIMATRKRSVAQLPITVVAASDDADHKKHAELVQSWLDEGVLQAALFDMLDAIGKGFSVLETDWQTNAWGNTLPRELIYRTPRWFTFDLTDGETVLLREGVANEPLAAHKFVVHRHKSKSGLTIRSGIARMASWSWMFKSFTVRDWAIFAQNFGQPIRVGKYGRGATEAEKDVLWRAVSGIAGDCAAIIPREMLIEFQEVASKGSSTDLFERRADWLDRQMSKVVLGQTATTDAIAGGHAVGKTHRLVQEDIERSDAMAASATINIQLIPNIVAFNFGPQDRYPKVHIGRPDEVPLSEFSTAFNDLGPLGLTAGISYIRNRFGIPAPAKGEELVGGRAAIATPVTPPVIPTKPARQTTQHLFAARHSVAQDALTEKLLARISEESDGAMSGLVEDVRKALMEATDLRDAAARLAQLDLSADQLTEAMARGMALAHLAGQAALIDDLNSRS